VAITPVKANGNGERRLDPAKAIGKVLFAIVSAVPSTSEPANARPRARALKIQTAAAFKAAAVSGSMALPPGPWALATILPDLFAVWRIQAQMVSDIAGVFGKAGSLSQEQMLYCLFKHAAAHVVRDLVSRVGERVVFRRATMKVLQGIARKLGSRVSRRVLAQSVSRWLPVLGSASVAGYAYYDTKRVGMTAIDLFEQVFNEQRMPS
jgi:hypothetical protein